MDSYFDIKAIPDPELIQSAVVGELMQAIHSLLPPFGGRVAVGFPAYGQVNTLGGIIRLYGIGSDLNDLHPLVLEQPGIGNYGLTTPIASIPETRKGYAAYSRLHVKGASHYRRLERRHKARGTWTDELADAIAKQYRQATHCPHVNLRSHTTNQRFILFIQQSRRKEAHEGEFNAYGLSVNGATVPLF